MLRLLGMTWVDVSKTSSTPVCDLMWGAVRVARVTSKRSREERPGTHSSFKLYQYAIDLPVGSGNKVGFAWEMSEAKRDVESIINEMLEATGVEDVFFAIDEGAEIHEFVIPDSMVVLEGLPAVVPSATILPIEDRRRTQAAGTSIAPQGKVIKPSHGSRRSLARGQ